MKREDTIKMYIAQFLEGKSDSQREAFLSKDINKQYASIMAWKYRNNNKEAQKGIGYAELSRHIRSLGKLIPTATGLTGRQIANLKKSLADTIEMLDNFSQIQRAQELKELEQQRQALEAKIDELRSKC